MSLHYKVISIGALSRHRLWSESVPIRTPHATTTLVTAVDRLILVDPSLPGPILAARFNERTGKTLDDVTDVFCTTLRPVHRHSIEAIPQANWWAAEADIQAYVSRLEQVAESADRLGDDVGDINTELSLLKRFKPAPETFGPQVHVYPLVGPSPGSAGLLLTPATQTILIAGDAALTREHLESGQVWQGCVDIDQAMASLTDLVEVADMVVCGHDNLIALARQWL